MEHFSIISFAKKLDSNTTENRQKVILFAAGSLFFLEIARRKLLEINREDHRTLSWNCKNCEASEKKSCNIIELAVNSSITLVLLVNST